MAKKNTAQGQQVDSQGEGTQARERSVVYLLVGTATKDGAMTIRGVFPGLGTAMQAYAKGLRPALAEGVELSVVKGHEQVGDSLQRLARPKE